MTSAFATIYLVLPILIYNVFWTLIVTVPFCILLFILSFHFERSKLAEAHNSFESESIQVVDTGMASLRIFINVFPLVFLWATTLIPIPILNSQELFLPALLMAGILLGGIDFETLGESMARFLFTRL